MSKKTSQKRMHAFKEHILCMGIGCKEEFLPERKDQVFCSPNCRLKFFTMARKLGVALLKESRIDPELKLVADRLLNLAL